MMAALCVQCRSPTAPPPPLSPKAEDQDQTSAVGSPSQLSQNSKSIRREPLRLGCIQDLGLTILMSSEVKSDRGLGPIAPLTSRVAIDANVLHLQGLVSDPATHISSPASTLAIICLRYHDTFIPTGLCWLSGRSEDSPKPLKPVQSVGLIHGQRHG